MAPVRPLMQPHAATINGSSFNGSQQQQAKPLVVPHAPMNKPVLSKKSPIGIHVLHFAGHQLHVCCIKKHSSVTFIVADGQAHSNATTSDANATIGLVDAQSHGRFWCQISAKHSSTGGHLTPLPITEHSAYKRVQ